MAVQRRNFTSTSHLVPSFMESLQNPPFPQTIKPESNGSVKNPSRLFDLRSSLPSVTVPTRKGSEVKVRLGSNMASDSKPLKKIEYGDGGYVLEDVPHLTDYLTDLPVS